MSRNYLPDETLIDNLLLDDTSAFEELHHRYCYSLYTYCMGKLNSPEDAKIIVRDIFIALWENRHTLPINFSISLHLYTEVRKAVVKSLNAKLLDEETARDIQEKIIPGFSIGQLQKARKPVQADYNSGSNYQQPSVLRKGNYESQWWNPSINFDGLKRSLTNMLNFF